MKLMPGNNVSLLTSGTEFFAAVLGEIDAARSDVSLETYIFADDKVGRSVAEALSRAARRGVAVRLLIDGFGSRDLSPALVARMKEAGVMVLVYRPEVSPLTLRINRLRRLHRKIALIDGRVGFVGGINIIDDYTEITTGHPRYDYCVRVQGPLLAAIYHSVYRLWRNVSWLHLRHRDPSALPPPVPENVAGDMDAAFVIRDNLRHRRDIENMYLEGIRIARREIIIACAYFLPGRRLRHGLKAAAQRGVRVVLLLQGWSDHPLFQQASRASYESMLDAGIEIYEYTRSELHAKVAVVDECWATVGSSNLDPFSLVLAREANVVVVDAVLARKLRASLEEALRFGAKRVPRMLWKHRSLPVRILAWIGYGFARLAMGVIGVTEEWL